MQHLGPRSPFARRRLLCSWEHPCGCGAGREVWDLPDGSSRGAAQRRGLARAPFEEMENPIICSFFSQREASEHSAAAAECGLLPAAPCCLRSHLRGKVSGSPRMGITFASPDPRQGSGIQLSLQCHLHHPAVGRKERVYREAGWGGCGLIPPHTHGSVGS